MNKKTTLIMLGAFVLALGAGTLLGVGIADKRPHGGRQGFDQALGLSPEQSKQIQAIREKVMQESRERFKKLDEEKTAALKKLLTPDQLVAYDNLGKEYQLKLEELKRQRDADNQESIKRTKAVLTAEQIKKFDEMMARGGERKDRGRGVSPATATSQPLGPGTNK